MTKIEKLLKQQEEIFLNQKKQIRKDRVTNVFKKRFLIPPGEFTVINYPRKPVAVFNPGALLKDKKVYIFPRLIFDYYKYVSSIGIFEIDIEDLLIGNFKSQKQIEVRIIIWPQHLWEFLGCEDPRVTLNNNEIYILYTGKGNSDVEEKKRDVIGFAKLDNAFNLKMKKHFQIRDGAEVFYPKSIKDSAFIKIYNSSSILLTRIHLNSFLGWIGICDIENSTIEFSSLKPIFAPEEWEFKIGWSTNAVKLSDEEYIIGWHSVLKEDLSYRNGFAIVNSKGELLSVSDYMLVPTGLQEEYGDRALVIFGNGLIKHEDFLIWIGGVGDYAIGIFIANLEDVLRNMRDL